MNSAYGEPSAKRRRLADGHNAAQQHSSSYLDTRDVKPSYPSAQMPSSVYSALPNPFTGHVTGSQYQQNVQAVPFQHPVQTQPVFYGSFGNAQPGMRAPNMQDQSGWGQMSYFIPPQVPLQSHVWHRPAAILPMPHHFYSQGVFPAPVQNCHSSPVETTTLSYATASVAHSGCPSSGQLVENVPTDGIAGLSPETASWSVDELVCFGVV